MINLSHPWRGERGYLLLCYDAVFPVVFMLCVVDMSLPNKLVCTQSNATWN